MEDREIENEEGEKEKEEKEGSTTGTPVLIKVKIIEEKIRPYVLFGGFLRPTNLQNPQNLK